MMEKTQIGNWITIKTNKKSKNIPYEIRIDKAGNVYIDGELYNETNSKYKNLSVSVEKYNKFNTGEETRKMIESQKQAKKGETKVITDIKDKNKSETTTVKW